jgi:hypothetical protein
MNNHSLVLKSWIVLAVAVVSWVGVVLFAAYLYTLESERIAYSEEVAAANVQEGQAALLHALARDTSADRAMLDTVTSVDVISAVNKIEAVRSGGVQMRITGAQAEKAQLGKNGAPATINPVILTAHAEGSFVELLHMIDLLETLPLAISIQSLDVGFSGAEPANPKLPRQWALDVRMRLLTSAPLPS